MARWVEVHDTGFVLAAEPIYAGISKRGRGDWNWHISHEYTVLRSGTERTKAAAMKRAEREFQLVTASPTAAAK